MATPNPVFTQSTDFSPVAVIDKDKAEFYMSIFKAHCPDLAEKCNGRTEKAIEIMTTVGARTRGDLPGIFLVKSQSNNRGSYVVDMNARTCTCPDFPKAPSGMSKHRLSIGVPLLAPQWQAAAFYRQCNAIHAAQDKAADFYRDTLNPFSTAVEAINPANWDDPQSIEKREKMYAAAKVYKELMAEAARLIAAPIIDFA